MLGDGKRVMKRPAASMQEEEEPGASQLESLWDGKPSEEDGNVIKAKKALAKLKSLEKQISVLKQNLKKGAETESVLEAMINGKKELVMQKKDLNRVLSKKTDMAEGKKSSAASLRL